MNRRTFLTCLSSLTLIPWIDDAKRSSPTLYNPGLAALLESELAKNYQRNNLKREPTHQANLREAYDIVKPVTFNDVVFVLWCGYRLKNNNDLAETYRLRKNHPRPLEEYYPFLPLAEYGCPDTQGIFVFREQLNMMLQNSFDMSSSQADDYGRKFYLLYTELEPGQWSKVNLVDYFFSGHNVKRSKADHLNEIGHFVGESRGTSLPYIWCAAIAERALVQLAYV